MHLHPLQLALVGRSVRDMQAQCATPLFRGPQVRGARKPRMHAGAVSGSFR